MVARVSKCDIMELMRSRILILDGAMGTCIQGYNLTPDDFLGGKGNNDILNLTREDIVLSIHKAYIGAGGSISASVDLQELVSSLSNLILEIFTIDCFLSILKLTNFLI